MSYIKNIVVVLSVWLLLSSISFGYNFTVVNGLDHPILVRLRVGRLEPYYYSPTIAPAKSYDFSFRINSQLSLNAEGTQKEYVGRKVLFCLSDLEADLYELNNDKWVPLDGYYPMDLTEISNKCRSINMKIIGDKGKFKIIEIK